MGRILALAFSLLAHHAVAADALRICALGDSYTIGEGVAADAGWPAQWAAALRRDGHVVAEPTVVARTGWTAGDLLAALARNDLATDYDLVTLQIGVNDQYRGRSVAAFAPDFAAVLARALAIAGAPERLIVLSIPDWGAMPFAAGQDRAAIAGRIDDFNDWEKRQVIAAGARWVDVTPISREALSEPALIAGDGLHPSAAMYARWVAVLQADRVDRAH